MSDESTPPPGSRTSDDQDEQLSEPPTDRVMSQTAHSPTVRPSLTLSEAARACRVSQSTIKRLHYDPDGSAFPNAWREPGPNGPGTGSWRIPVTDLIQAGFTPNRLDRPVDPVREQGSEPPSAAEKLSEAMSDRDRFRVEAERWRAVADERERALQRMDRAFNMLGEGRQQRERPEPEWPQPKRPNPVNREAGRRRWWRRNG